MRVAVYYIAKDGVFQSPFRKYPECGYLDNEGSWVGSTDRAREFHSEEEVKDMIQNGYGPEIAKTAYYVKEYKFY